MTDTNIQMAAAFGGDAVRKAQEAKPLRRFIIEETIQYEIEAEDAQTALDDFLHNGAADRPISITDRHVYDENDNECDVEG